MKNAEIPNSSFAVRHSTWRANRRPWVPFDLGRGSIGLVIAIALAAAIAYAAYHVLPVYLTYFKFKDAMQDAVQSAVVKSDRQVIDDVLAKAAELNVPVTEPQVSFRREPQRAVLEADYEVEVLVLPAYKVRWKFAPQAEVPLYSIAPR